MKEHLDERRAQMEDRLNSRSDRHAAAAGDQRQRDAAAGRREQINSIVALL